MSDAMKERMSVLTYDEAERLMDERDRLRSELAAVRAELREAAWIIQRSESADLEVKHYAAAFLTRHRGGTK